MLLPSSEGSGSGCDRLYRQVSRVDWLKVLGTKSKKAWAQRRQQIGPSTEGRCHSWSMSGQRTTTVVFRTVGIGARKFSLASSHEGWVGSQENMSVWDG